MDTPGNPSLTHAPDSVNISSLKKGKGNNDNSNPQQGSGGTRPFTTVRDASKGVGRRQTKVPYSRPSLKIPPTLKDDRKLFVGGLPANVTSEEFRSFFEQFGPVMDSIVLVDTNTDRSRGFGFVTFEDVSSAKKILAMGHKEGSCPADPAVGRLEMQGKMIEVKAAQPKESNRRSIPNAANQFDPSPMYAAPPPVVPMPFDPYMVMMPPADFLHPSQQAPYPPPNPFFAGYVAPMYYTPNQTPEFPPMPNAAVPPHPMMMEGGYAPSYFVSNTHYAMMPYPQGADVVPLDYAVGNMPAVPPQPMMMEGGYNPTYFIPDTHYAMMPYPQGAAFVSPDYSLDSDETHV